MVNHLSNSKQNVYSYSNDTFKFKDYRKVIDKALSMGLEIDYLDMTELYDIGDAGFAIGGYPLDKLDEFLSPDFSVGNTCIDFKYGEKQFLQKCSFSEDRVLLCIPTLRMKAVISYMN